LRAVLDAEHAQRGAELQHPLMLRGILALSPERVLEILTTTAESVVTAWI
jgi:hypothetical protein